MKDIREEGDPGHSRPPSPRLCRKPFPSLKLRFNPRKGSSGKCSHPTTLVREGGCWLAADTQPRGGTCPCEGRRGASRSFHPRPEHKDARWCGRGRAPPSAFEPLGLEAEGAPASPVLARETRQNEGRGGREERDGLRRGAAAVLLLPGHPAGADTCQVLACASVPVEREEKTSPQGRGGD